MKNKSAMTLIEVMVAISLVLLTLSALGWKMHGMIAKKRFTSSVERLKSRLLTCRRLALNMQADWSCVVECGEKNTIFTAQCLEYPSSLETFSLTLEPVEFLWNGEKKIKFSFDFTASGDILPQGCLQIRKTQDMSVEWNLPGLFSLSEGNRLGPLHPDDLKQ